MTIFGEEIYVPAIMGASGVTKEQAKTCLYYAITTFLLPEKINLMPLLVIMGSPGTGKSDLLTQMGKLVNEPKVVSVQTKAALRNELHNTTTALIDEGGQIDEDLLIRRYGTETGTINYNKSYGGSAWVGDTAKVFGATIIVRRMPFQDAALTSRSIIINTRYNPDTYQIMEFKKAHERFSNIAEKLKLDDETSERTRNNWQPLQAIAKHLKDEEWLEYSNGEIEKSIKSFVGSQKYELEPALLIVLRENMIMLKGKGESVTGDVPLRVIKDVLKTEYGIRQNYVQIEGTCQNLGFTVANPSGYPKVKENRKLLERLLKERAK